jgi:ribosomal protein L37E
MSFKCPACARPLYNRRRKDCEFCGAPIPRSLQFSESQKQRFDRLKADEAKQHRDFIQSLPTSNSAGIDLIF